MAIASGIDKSMVSVGVVGPTSCVGEGIELRLAYLSTRFVKEHLVIGFELNGGST
ncbi:MAG: hypothetical protein ACJ8LL_04340 [Candidatus Udaeobacter sp.]